MAGEEEAENVTKFARTIQPMALASLRSTAESASDNWWKDLLPLWRPSATVGELEGLRLALRRNYLNLYAAGQSVAKVAFNAAGEPCAITHVKYAYGPSETSQEYARLTGREIRRPKAGVTLAYEGIETLRNWVQRAKCFKGEEKQFVDDLVASNSNVIDLEMGLPAAVGRTSALRLDLVALERHDGHLRVVFWEAKTISDGRLRSRLQPEVLSQIENYRNYINSGSHLADVIDAYRESCKLLIDLHKMAANVRAIAPLDPLVHEAASSKIELGVDPTPRLVIYDSAPATSAAWLEHEAKLKENNVRYIICKQPPHILRSLEAMT